MTSRRRKRGRLATAALAALIAAPLAACSSEGSSDWLALFGTFRESWENRGGAVSLTQAGAIPYASLGVRLDGGEEHLFVLATDAGGERLWVSSARVSLSIRDGRIARTSGLTADLSGYEAKEGKSAPWTEPHAVIWTADFADLGVYSARVSCQDVPAGRETTTILGADLDTLRVEESCRADTLDWSFSNTYWVSVASGRVWKSRQFVHPKSGPVEFEILRPPESAG